MRGGDEYLCISGQQRQQGAAAGGVKLTENIVNEQNRGMAGLNLQEPGLCQYQGCSQCALLPLRGKINRRTPVNGQFKVVSVRANGGEACALISINTLFKCFMSRQVCGGAVMNLNLLMSAGNSAMQLTDVGAQQLQ